MFRGRGEGLRVEHSCTCHPLSTDGVFRGGGEGGRLLWQSGAPRRTPEGRRRRLHHRESQQPRQQVSWHVLCRVCQANRVSLNRRGFDIVQ